MTALAQHQASGLVGSEEVVLAAAKAAWAADMKDGAKLRGETVPDTFDFDWGWDQLAAMPLSGPGFVREWTTIARAVLRFAQQSAKTSEGVPDEGAQSLTKLGLDYYYDAEDWESTHDAGDLEAASDWLSEEQGYGNGTRAVATLINGPTLHAGHYPIGWVEDSDPADIDDWELRFFRSHRHWREAVDAAIAARALASPTPVEKDDRHGL